MDFKDLNKQIKDALKDVLNKSTFDEIGKITSESIKKRTRLGKGVDQSEGPLVPLKELKPSTKDRRTAKKKAGTLSNNTTPTKSNLTDTGAMLDSIKYESSATEVRIYIDGSENQKKANDQATQGRRFMNLSKTEVANVVRFLQKKFTDSFNKG